MTKNNNRVGVVTPTYLTQDDHKLIPSLQGRGSKGVGVTLDKFCDKLSEPVCVADSGSIQFDENTLRDKLTLIDSGSEPGMTINPHPTPLPKGEGMRACHSEGEARKNPADSSKSWIASVASSFAMTIRPLSEGEGRVRVR
ncbi:MAG: hypothetical protein NC191_07965, partial [Muribaculaceae bacterium]|nr:hypothetical protein [Muribaculaceae bacterium]